MATAVSSFTPVSNTPIDESAPAAVASGGGFKPISNTPIDESKAAMPSTLGYLGGLAETGLHFASGAVAPFAGGLNYLAAIALTRGDTAAAKAVQEATENALTYQPRSEVGQDLDTAFGILGKATIGNATDAVSDKAADVGGPLAGAAARTTLEGLPYVLGARAPIESLLDNPRGAVRDLTTYRSARGPAPAVAPGETSAPAGTAPAAATPSDPARAPGAASAPATPATARTVAPATPEVPAGGGVPPGPGPKDITGLQAGNPPVFWTGQMADDLEAKVNANPDLKANVDIDAERANTLKEIGLTEARESAVTGDKGGAASDYQYAKLDHEGGKAAAASFETERNALNAYTDKLVADAQGSSGLDETSLYNRGQTILTPFQELSEAYDHQIKQLYTAADANAQGMPVDLNATSQMLGNRAAFIGTTEGQQLLRGVNAYLRQAGVIDDAGQFQGATVQQAERLKQYVGEQWSPRTARLIRTVKDAVDEDVVKSAGSDVYQQARAMRASRAKLLDNPKGVASLLESSGPDGINRSVNLERIPDTVARMPVDQFNHIIETLESMPRELNSKATAALGEIRSQLLLRMQEQAGKLKGAWNNKGVTEYLNSNRMKLSRVMSPAEMQRLTRLNNAGNILDVDRTYPGAAVQTHNMLQSGALGLTKAAIHTAASHFPVVGNLAAAPVASALDRAFSGATTRKAWSKRVRKL